MTDRFRATVTPSHLFFPTTGVGTLRCLPPPKKVIKRVCQFDSTSRATHHPVTRSKRLQTLGRISNIQPKLSSLSNKVTVLPKDARRWYFLKTFFKTIFFFKIGNEGANLERVSSGRTRSNGPSSRHCLSSWTLDGTPMCHYANKV